MPRADCQPAPGHRQAPVPLPIRSLVFRVMVTMVMDGSQIQLITRTRTPIPSGLLSLPLRTGSNPTLHRCAPTRPCTHTPLCAHTHAHMPLRARLCMHTPLGTHALLHTCPCTHSPQTVVVPQEHCCVTGPGLKIQAPNTLGGVGRLSMGRSSGLGAQRWLAVCPGWSACPLSQRGPRGCWVSCGSPSAAHGCFLPSGRVDANSESEPLGLELSLALRPPGCPPSGSSFALRHGPGLSPSVLPACPTGSPSPDPARTLSSLSHPDVLPPSPHSPVLPDSCHPDR